MAKTLKWRASGEFAIESNRNHPLRRIDDREPVQLDWRDYLWITGRITWVWLCVLVFCLAVSLVWPG